jgi:acetyl esterase
MPLHPALQHLIEQKLAHTVAPQWELPTGEVRAAFRRLWTPELTGPAPRIERVEDRSVELEGRCLPVRIYAPGGAERAPAVLYFHGGGYVKGGIEESDAFCRRLAATSGHALVSVGYRLAPEHPFPAALDDALAATLWAFEHALEIGARAGGVMVAGESAGGNLAAVVALVARGRGDVAITRQVLLQPVLDFSLSFPSIAMSPTECLVPRDDLAWYYRTYCPEGDRRDARLSPLWADDLSGLPQALIIAAEYDTLRDEAAAYAGRLRAAGVATRYVCYPGMIHGFLQMAGLVDEARQATGEIADFLRA